MERVDGFPQTWCSSEELQTPRNGTSKARRRIVVATHVTLPHAHRLVGLCRNLLHLWPLPARVVEVTRTRLSGLRRRPSSHLFLQNPSSALEKSGFPGHQPPLRPSSRTSKASTPVHVTAHFGSPIPSTNPVPPSRFLTPSAASSASLSRACCIPHQTWGSPRCTLFAPPPKWVGAPPRFPRRNLPSKNSPHSRPYPVARVSFPLAVGFSRVPPGEAKAMPLSRSTRLPSVWHLCAANHASREKPRFRGIHGAPKSPAGLDFEALLRL